jgi:hypothetical protein
MISSSNNTPTREKCLCWIFRLTFLYLHDSEAVAEGLRRQIWLPPSQPLPHCTEFPEKSNDKWHKCHILTWIDMNWHELTWMTWIDVTWIDKNNMNLKKWHVLQKVIFLKCNQIDKLALTPLSRLLCRSSSSTGAFSSGKGWDKTRTKNKENRLQRRNSYIFLTDELTFPTLSFLLPFLNFNWFYPVCRSYIVKIIPHFQNYTQFSELNKKN